MKKVAMIGVGKLGQDCAEVMAEHYHVLGYDVVPRTPSNFEMRNTIKEAVEGRDFIFIAAPTPHDPIYGGETPTSHLPNKDFDYTIVTEILQEVNKHVNKNQLVVLISTVLPGTVRNVLEPCITNARFIYNPYLIAMGTVKWDMVNPEMVIIGTENGSLTGDASELIDFYKVFMQNNPRYEVGTWDEAESIKIFYNTFISTKIALVNMIQDVAETNGNINVDVVTNALAKSTHRIMGPAYMKAGLGDAGACHPRDNIALRYLAERLDLGYDLFDSIMTAREVQAERMALKCLKNGKNITIVGKAYKPAVPYTNGSASMLVGYYIEKHGGNVKYFDRNTGDHDLNEDWTDVYLIGYWDDFVEKTAFPNHATVIDPWRKLTNKNHSGEIIHYGDTRVKSEDQFETDIASHLTHLYNIYPELKKYDDKIHLIYSGVHPVTPFIRRPLEDIVIEIKDAVAKGKTKFLFDNFGEGFMSHVIHKIQRIHKVLNGLVDSKNMFYLTGATDGKEVYDNVKHRFNWDNDITIISANFFEYISRNCAYGFEDMVEYEPRLREKSFLCFNKVHREHRMLLLEEVLKNDLLDRSFYSFEGAEDWKKIVSTLSDRYSHIRKNANLFPLRLNITPERTNPVNIIGDDIKYFTESYFSVVTETLFFQSNNGWMYHNAQVEPCIFPSEKIYKCMTMMHPFIVVGRPGFLKSLREQGFKTFSPHIDESYDLIEDDIERMTAIVNEIKRLCSLNNDELIEWQNNVKDIVVHNKDRFLNHSQFRVTKNIEQYFEN